MNSFCIPGIADKIKLNIPRVLFTKTRSNNYFLDECRKNLLTFTRTRNHRFIKREGSQRNPFLRTRQTHKPKVIKNKMGKRKSSVDLVVMNNNKLLNRHLLLDQQRFNVKIQMSKKRKSNSKIKNQKNVISNYSIRTLKHLPPAKQIKNKLLRTSIAQELQIKHRLKTTPKNPIDIIIKFLKSILSFSITESVFLKDFIKLYIKFYNGKLTRFGYRSKSCKPLQTYSDKKNLFRISDFRNFLINLCMQFMIVNNYTIKEFYISCIIRNNNSIDLDKSAYFHKKKKDDKVRFKFLEFNKITKHFCKVIKIFNKTGRIVRIDKKRLASSIIKSRIPRINRFRRRAKLNFNIPVSSVGQLKKHTDALNYIKSFKSVSQFQQIINKKVELEKENAAYMCRRSKKLSTKMSLFEKKKSMFRKSSVSIKPTKKREISSLNRKVSLNCLYKIPKTIDSNTMYTAFKFHRRRKSEASTNKKTFIQHFRIKTIVN